MRRPTRSFFSAATIMLAGLFLVPFLAGGTGMVCVCAGGSEYQALFVVVVSFIGSVWMFRSGIKTAPLPAGRARDELQVEVEALQANSWG